MPFVFLPVLQRVPTCHVVVAGCSAIDPILARPENRPVHALSCIMGNQGKMAGNSKVCMGFQSQLILPELIYLTRSL